jgi:hypothetical protein
VIKTAWLADKVCMVSVNHLTQPHLLRVKNGKFEALEYTDIRKYPAIARPKDAGGAQMEAEECLGSTLGCFVIESIIAPPME